MADLKDIRGIRVQALASDPDQPGSVAQIFYNDTTGVFKAIRAGTAADGTWSSGGSLNTARYANSGAGASLSAALSFGGATPSRTAITESYDGSSWTEVNDLNTAANELGGSGTQTAALAAGGAIPPGTASAKTESWDGSNWTEVNDLNTAKDNFSQSAGTQTANLISGGYGAPPSTYQTQTETWNGSSWTEVNDMNTARGLHAILGTQTAAIVGSGNGNSGLVTAAESWDGTNWTEIAELNTPRDRQFGNGIQTSGFIAGGREPANSGKTEFWTGTAWTEVGDMSTVRFNGSSLPASGGATTGIAAGGEGATVVTSTEEWTVDITNGTITVS